MTFPGSTESSSSLFARSGVRCYNALAMERISFEDLVADALDSLPDEVVGWLDNVGIVIARWPTPAQLASAGLRPGETLFGLYVGVPKTNRGFTYGETLPDKIVIFQGPIEQFCRTPAQIRDCVRKTVLHEIGHHFGLDEWQLRDAGV
jgi:predicted Zn-dependent protease with MMP-like domain